jgi:predicted nucleotidyltransferase
MSLEILTDLERRTLHAYVALLRERLGDDLLAVRVFGSAARGEAWWDGMPIRSDLDLLVLVAAPLPQETIDALVAATLPLFLECGRQLGPQFRTREGLAEGSPEFADELRRDAIVLYDASRRLRQKRSSPR